MTTAASLLGGASYGTGNTTLAEAGPDEHIIRCSICGRSLIVKDTVNNGVAFLSHLKIDHGITYFALQMSRERTAAKKGGGSNSQALEQQAPTTPGVDAAPTKERR
jgi:hypothetical protein